MRKLPSALAAFAAFSTMPHVGAQTIAPGALERGPLIAGRLVEMLLVRREILEGIGRAGLVLGERKIAESGLASVRTQASDHAPSLSVGRSASKCVRCP